MDTSSSNIARLFDYRLFTLRKPHSPLKSNSERGFLRGNRPKSFTKHAHRVAVIVYSHWPNSKLQFERRIRLSFAWTCWDLSVEPIKVRQPMAISILIISICTADGTTMGQCWLVLNTNQRYYSLITSRRPQILFMRSFWSDQTIAMRVRGGRCGMLYRLTSTYVTCMCYAC